MKTSFRYLLWVMAGFAVAIVTVIGITVIAKGRIEITANQLQELEIGDQRTEIIREFGEPRTEMKDRIIYVQKDTTWYDSEIHIWLSDDHLREVHVERLFLGMIEDRDEPVYSLSASGRDFGLTFHDVFPESGANK